MLSNFTSPTVAPSSSSYAVQIPSLKHKKMTTLLVTSAVFERKDSRVFIVELLLKNNPLNIPMLLMNLHKENREKNGGH